MKGTGSGKTLGLVLLLALILGSAPAVFGQSEGYGPGRVGLSILAGRDHEEIGTGGIWNSRYKLHIQLDPADGWRIKKYHIDLGGGEDYSPPLTTTGNPKIGFFDYKEEFNLPYMNEANEDGHPFRQTLVLDLDEDLGFKWGMPWADLRTQGVAIFVELVRLDDEMNVLDQASAWVVPELITWIVEEEETVEAEAEADPELVVGEDEVADAFTGELVDLTAIKIEKAAKGKVAQNEHKKAQRSWEVEEAEEIIAFDGGRWGWWFRFTLGHPETGHFIDSPVSGLYVETPTYEGLLADDAAFDYFPGEEVEIYLGDHLLGRAMAEHKISPLDVFPSLDTEDNRVINMARFLQSMDEDGEAQGGIVILPQVAEAFAQAMDYHQVETIDFADDLQIDNLINRTIEVAAVMDPPVLLTNIPAEDAVLHLEDTLSNVMFRKRISRTPHLSSAKSKMNSGTTWLPALPASADENTRAAALRYYDEGGNLIREATEAKPIVVAFTDVLEGYDTADVWAAVSRDDGATWKRKNISRMADRSSFILENGRTYYGDTRKPVFQIKGNKVLIAWTSKYARGGKPRYAIDPNDDYPYDDPYAVDDFWGVGGAQRSHNYIEDGFPEVGELPYSAVWTCRGVIATQADVDAGVGRFVGDIVWFKPERLTSGRRDAYQLFLAAADGAGFALIWQEDPKGLMPGDGAGPGHGWSGATTNHKTDVWYSYLSWGDHSKVDFNFVEGGDPEHDLDVLSRPKALVPMALPVRISDNDVLNTRNMGLEDITDTDDLAYTPESLTRCVKFEKDKTIVPADDPYADLADYVGLRHVPEDHKPTMNCTNCHVPYGLPQHSADAPTQGGPVPLLVVDAEADDYVGGFTNGECVACHFSHIVPRDRIIPVTSGLSEDDKCLECEAKGGIWKDGTQEGGEIVEAYYPYEGYPYMVSDDRNDGAHRYGQEVPDLLSGEYYTFINNQGNERSVAITTDGRLLDGNTGASRPNIFLQPYVTASGKKSAWAIITYEETKGVGNGPRSNDGEEQEIPKSDSWTYDEGKNVIFHSFDFKAPDVVSEGHIVNPPEFETTTSIDEFGNEVAVKVLDASGNPIPKYALEEDGTYHLDWAGRPQLVYENARRGRFILQGVGAIGDTRTVMAMVYKMGEEGHGRPSDIFLNRWVVPADIDLTTENPYAFENMAGERVYDAGAEREYLVSGFHNVSSVTPTVTTPSVGDPETDDPYGAVKVVEWRQTAANLDDVSFRNRFDDSRAHRGALRGDLLIVGFTYCPNWAAKRNGNDKYDFYVRRSFDGGETFTTDPAGAGVEHSYTWTYPSGTESPGLKVEEVNFYEPGGFESMRNLSQLKNNKESCIEPRIVATPGTIKVSGSWTRIPEDKQDQSVFYASWGTETNPKKDPVTKEQDDPVPADLYYTFSRDRGEGYYQRTWVVNPDSDGNYAGETVTSWDWLAKGDDVEQGEAQLRLTPDGSRFYACWLEEGPEGSDIMFRRIMSSEFPQNVAVEETAEEAEVDVATSTDDFTSDSGGDFD